MSIEVFHPLAPREVVEASNAVHTALLCPALMLPVKCAPQFESISLLTIGEGLAHGMGIIRHYHSDECPQHPGELYQVVRAQCVNDSIHDDVPRQFALLHLDDVEQSEPSEVHTLTVVAYSGSPLFIHIAVAGEVLHLLAHLLVRQPPSFGIVHAHTWN